MFYIFDQDGYKGDFGSAETVAALEEIGLKEFNSLLSAGFTLEPEKIIDEIEGIGDVFSEFSDILNSIAETLKSCGGFAMISSSVY